MKGISEIVSAVLVLAVGISIVSVYSEFAPALAGNLVGEAKNQTNQDLTCSNAALSINSAEYDKSSNSTIFHLENDGTIRFARGLTIGVYNSSTQEIARKSVKNLEVEQKKRISIDTEKVPSSILVTSKSCPRIKADEDRIDVHK